MPRKKLSHLIRKTRSTKNIKAKRRRGRRRMRRRAVPSLAPNRRQSHHLHHDLSGPPEPVPDWQQLQILETIVRQKKRAKTMESQIVVTQRETQSRKNTKNMQPKRRRRRKRKMKRSPRLDLHLIAVLLRGLSLKVKVVKGLLRIDTLQL